MFFKDMTLCSVVWGFLVGQRLEDLPGGLNVKFTSV